MVSDTIRVGIVGLGANTRLRHVPGLRACAGVEIVAVSNRRPESTAAAAREFGIPRTFDRWQDLVQSRDIDAVVIGTWPYLHCPITLAAFDAGKHVLTEARMAMTAAEARQMLDASRRHPKLVAQIVPSPFGLRANRVVKELLASGYIGELREVVVIGTSDMLADPATPLHWRQVVELSGVTRFGPGSQIHLYGSEGTLKYELHPRDRLLGARRGDAELREIDVPPDKAMAWRVEADFIDAIRGCGKIELTDFATGVRYMEFTDAVARSARAGQPVVIAAGDAPG